MYKNNQEAMEAMAKKIKVDGADWEIIRDCGDFWVAKKADSDEVRNVYKPGKGKDQVAKPDSKPSKE